MQESQLYDVRTLAYVVMPDHCHWLVRLSGERTLSRSVGAVKSVSSRRIKKHIGCVVRVWNRNYYDRAIRRNDSLIEVARYIISNPIRAGLVASMREYSLWDAIWVDDEFML